MTAPALAARGVTTPALDSVTCADALALMARLPNASVDLFVTSPPYNLRNSTGNGLRSKGGLWTNDAFVSGYSAYDDDLPHDVYVRWQREVLAEMMRCLPENGAIFYNHKWRVQNGRLQDRSDIVAGFPVRQIIIWDRGHGFNFNSGYFVPMYEVIYLITKPNFQLARGANVLSDVWRIEPEQNKAHPNSFPKSLPLRCIQSTMAPLICDPFMGSGTTAVAARDLGRDFIGCDISAEYVELARRRVAQPYTLPMFPDAGESSSASVERESEAAR